MSPNEIDPAIIESLRQGASGAVPVPAAVQMECARRLCLIEARALIAKHPDVIAKALAVVRRGARGKA